LSAQVAKAREQIQSSLKQKSAAPKSSGGVPPSDDAEMREENLLLKKQLENLQNQVMQLTDRVSKLEKSVGGSAPAGKAGGDSQPKKEEADDDVDFSALRMKRMLMLPRFANKGSQSMQLRSPKSQPWLQNPTSFWM